MYGKQPHTLKKRSVNFDPMVLDQISEAVQTGPFNLSATIRTLLRLVVDNRMPPPEQVTKSWPLIAKHWDNPTIRLMTLSTLYESYHMYRVNQIASMLDAQGQQSDD